MPAWTISWAVDSTGKIEEKWKLCKNDTEVVGTLKDILYADGVTGEIVVTPHSTESAPVRFHPMSETEKIRRIQV